MLIPLIVHNLADWKFVYLWGILANTAPLVLASPWVINQIDLGYSSKGILKAVSDLKFDPHPYPQVILKFRPSMSSDYRTYYKPQTN